MERDKKSLSLFILLPLLLVCRTDACPSLPDNLTCYNDYSKNITCLWNSTYVTDRTDAACTIHAKYQARYLSYSASCHLEPVDISRPALKTCSLIFKSDHTFSSFHVLSFNLSCNHMKPVITSYKPYCHIRVNPPGRPEVNFTTISWLSQLTEHSMIDLYKSEVQWKQQDQSWSDPAVQKNIGIQCEHKCEAELKEDFLIRGERYEARVRVQSVIESREGAWSDWSPTASWVSSAGKIKPPLGIAYVVTIIVVGVVMSLAVMFLLTKKTGSAYQAEEHPAERMFPACVHQ
ncbi:interleukin-2 receptor subunit beta-like isoform X2 [Archocentrus centrarchus]|uniref:interleukin-2 receptor subunit beta-like isoform X2 n=1 Tax=Archocentrus centrarchus TaxID=63155 RepID=UPI0011E9FAA9|nr:interleukin-2 receptor subunit beta-like isoform X2 [Archocentrus centrarchus]